MKCSYIFAHSLPWSREGPTALPRDFHPNEERGMADPRRNIADQGSNPRRHSSGLVGRPAQRDGGEYQPIQNSQDSLPGYDSKNNPLLSKELPGFGEPQQKKYIDFTDTTAFLGTFAVFLAAFFAVSPFTSTPWRLGLTRQFQVIGLLLSAMNLCFLSLASKVFVLVEARFGPSYLQNYDAIICNSFIKSKTSIIWRGILILVAIVPVALSLAYKEFNHGTGHLAIGNKTGNYYGLFAPAGLQDRFVGLAYFMNTTVSFSGAIFDDPPMPSLPSAYGFNTLLLSNTSSAKLDAPSPEYVLAIQRRLMVDEAYNLTADVYATVTSYNNSVESHRDDDEFWNYYLSQMHDPPNQYLSQPNPSGDNSKDSYLESKLSGQDLYNGQSMSLLINSFFSTNTSWMFFAFIPTVLEYSNVSVHAEVFRQQAMLYHTRRENCTGTWRITYNSIQLVSGVCNKPPLPDERQNLFTSATMALPQWYMTSLTEFLGPFTHGTRNQSHWLMPASCTVFAGMYWSRATAFNVVGLLGLDTTTDSSKQATADTYYLVSDNAISSRPTMNSAPLLYLTLAVYPVLTALLLISTLLMYNTPLDSGFGMIALLAGVRTETLKLLNGASRSGKLKKSIRVTIDVHKSFTDKDLKNQHNEYVLDEYSRSKAAPPM